MPIPIILLILVALAVAVDLTLYAVWANRHPSWLIPFYGRLRRRPRGIAALPGRLYRPFRQMLYGAIVVPMIGRPVDPSVHLVRRGNEYREAEEAGEASTTSFEGLDLNDIYSSPIPPGTSPLAPGQRLSQALRRFFTPND